MDEFLKIDWYALFVIGISIYHLVPLSLCFRGLNDLTKLEPQVQGNFINEDVLSTSLVYQFLQDNTLFRLKKAKRIIFNQNLYIPGQCKINTYEKSMLDEFAHEACLTALKIFHSGKDPSCYTCSDQFYIDIFKVSF